MACRVLNVSRSGYYEWVSRLDSPRGQENALLLKHITDIHAESRGTYGSPRVHAELTLGLGLPVNLKRVARLMREAGIQGLYRRRRHGCTVRDPDASPAPTWSTGRSPSTPRTGCGSLTSPSIPRWKGGCTARRSWTPIPG